MTSRVSATPLSDRAQAQNLLDFIDASPSPWHAVDQMETRLKQCGFNVLNETEPWAVQPGGRYYVVRGESSIVAFVAGQIPVTDSGFRIVGAHTDSPGLRVKPNAVQRNGKIVRLGVEIYGAPILATFTDRDLGLAGRVGIRTGHGGLETRRVCFSDSWVRLPNLAIHMNRNVNENGLKLQKQSELPLILSLLEENIAADVWFKERLATQAECEPSDLLSWELNVYDTQKGAFFGPEAEFLADSQLDNLASCHAALTAMLSIPDLSTGATAVCAFFDHEEIGSESVKGANSSFLEDVLERIGLAQQLNRQAYKQSLARSFLVSADMAHAFQPNFASAYEPDHPVLVNAGPVIKINANHRYTSETVSEGMIMLLCEQARVACQKYVHRTDSPCGSTIGPMASARLGVRSVDIGCPLWAMHSARESAGVADHNAMIQLLLCFFTTKI